jgi:hypothetical protein
MPVSPAFALLYDRFGAASAAFALPYDPFGAADPPTPSAGLEIHISSTSLISAANTSSIACTPESASACSRSAAFFSFDSAPGASG